MNLLAQFVDVARVSYFHTSTIRVLKLDIEDKAANLLALAFIQPTKGALTKLEAAVADGESTLACQFSAGSSCQ